eukprot:6417035-Pyramimonas_sp.AAC.1
MAATASAGEPARLRPLSRRKHRGRELDSRLCRPRCGTTTCAKLSRAAPNTCAAAMANLTSAERHTDAW